MSGIVVLVVIALVSLLVTRVATIALTVTGLPRQSARFQARSALSGVGFTTSESEQVVNHPARRRIVMALMLIGNVGLVTAVAGRNLAELRLKDEGLLLIGVVHADGNYVGVPGPETKLHPGDTAIVYGRGAAFEALTARQAGLAGEWEHRAMVAEQERLAETETGQA